MRRRTIVNQTPGERLLKMADPEGSSVAWDLQYTGLTDAEMGAFEALFESCEGRLRPFVFVDPLGNLLRWTEDLNKGVWQTGLLVVTAVEDPTGGTGACRLTNGAQGVQRISQAVDAPTSYTYTFGVWAKSNSATSLRLGLDNGTSTISVDVAVQGEWECYSVSASGPDSGDSVRCFIEVPAATAVDVYGPQLDAQPDASEYRKATDKSGVHMARFDQDVLERRTFGPDNHSTRLRVVTVEE